jgi:hypothetical protein
VIPAKAGIQVIKAVWMLILRVDDVLDQRLTRAPSDAALDRFFADNGLIRVPMSSTAV